MGIASLFLGWLSSARAKSVGFSSTAALRDYVVRILKTKPGVENVSPDPGDPAQFHIEMGELSSTGNVSNLFKYLKGNPNEDPEFIVGRFINSVADMQISEVGEDDIFAVIRSRDYVDGMVGGGASIFHEPLGADLVILYMVDRPDSMAPLTAQEVPGKDLASLRSIALNNQRRWLPKIVSDDTLKSGVLYFVEENPMLSPGLLLLDDFWRSIATRFPGDVIIALPRKDQLFLFDEGPAAKRLARELIDGTFEDGYNLLSPLLYARRNGNIVLVPD